MNKRMYPHVLERITIKNDCLVLDKDGSGIEEHMSKRLKYINMQIYAHDQLNVNFFLKHLFKNTGGNRS